MVGDSLASFNPVYGQGMSVAALEAVALARQLSGERVPPSRAVMGELARIVDVPWQLAGAVDRAFLPSDQPQARRDRLMAAYVDRVQAAAEHDPVVGRGFLRVSGLIDPPSALLRPRLMWRTLRRRFAAHSAAWTAAAGAGPRRSEPGLAVVVMSMFTMSVVLAAALLGPVLVLVGARSPAFSSGVIGIIRHADDRSTRSIKSATRRSCRPPALIDDECPQLIAREHWRRIGYAVHHYVSPCCCVGTSASRTRRNICRPNSRGTAGSRRPERSWPPPRSRPR